MHNPDFKGNEFVTFKLQAGLNSFLINAHLIKENIPQPQRLLKLNEIAIQQMRLLSAYNYSHLLEHKKESPEKRGVE